MPAQRIAIVNASTVLKDAEIEKWITPLQRGVDQFCKDWEPIGAKPAQLIFIPLHHGALPRDVWPIYINRHSTDPGALGWHTKEGLKVYGRVFAGDCIRFGVSPCVDLDHEIKETIGDPPADRVFKMASGQLAALEACDAVESDDLKLDLGDGVFGSNYVLPAYFSAKRGVKYDPLGALKSPCAGLTPGGYMSVTQDGQWSQVTMDRRDGLRGRRFLMFGHRTEMRRMQGVPDDAGALTS